MLIQADARANGRICKGQRLSPATEFKPGTHWRRPRPWWNREWLIDEYVNKRRSTADIAIEHGVTDSAIQFWLRKHGIAARSISAARAIKYWGAEGERNPMYGKRGELNANWKGGQTPARQRLYASAEWRAVERQVKQRDRCCRRCGSTYRLEIHHIETFGDAPLLALELSNLIRLCAACHHSIRRRERRWRRRLRLLLECGGRAAAC